jgi:lipoate-protein ligase A
METWRLLQWEYRDPFRNLAVEEALARGAARGTVPGTLRFWSGENAVIIGRFQDPLLEVNLEACRRYGTLVARRFTGGGAVYHDAGNLNWTVAVPKEHPLVRSSDIDIHRVSTSLIQGVIEGVRILGAEAVFVPPGDLCIQGRKVSGTAGALKWGAVLFHGTLLVSSNLERIETVLTPRSPKTLNPRAVRSVRKPMINLWEALGREVTMAEVRTSLREGFQAALKIRLENGGLTPEEWETIRMETARPTDREPWNILPDPAREAPRVAALSPRVLFPTKRNTGTSGV